MDDANAASLACLPSVERSKLTKIIASDRCDQLLRILKRCQQHSSRAAIANLVLDRNDNTAVHIASHFAAINSLRLLFDYGGEAVNVSLANKEGKTALHEAVIGGSAQCVRLLLDRGWFVDAIKRGDWTPLMLAVTCARFEVTKLLIEQGKANIHLVNKDGWNCFHLAVRSGDFTTVSYLLSLDECLFKNRSNNNRSPLHSCALHGHYNIAYYLINNKCYESIDEKDMCGNTPFIEAIKSSSIAICKLLIANDCDPRVSDKLQRNVLHIAAECNADESIVYLLNELSFDVNEQCARNGFTALHYAAKEGHSSTIEILKQFQCRLDLRDIKGRLPIDVAISFNHIQCVTLLK
ncbi:hypothetical protein B4U79_08317 [Dinothrombium tinctorium]|uniref:Alpha-latrotoxin n=1 Tax=Dinothrombium tinctorium TaxID=1965070 RepID=A0A3S3PH23_9ACAR|nr:hypothetical protein B4U79_08317 [Dinothrombium tinctorium]